VSRTPSTVASTTENRSIKEKDVSEERTYLPAMGHDWMLPLYDPFTRLLGAGRVHGELIDQADPRPGMRALEIGTGTGNLLLRLKRRHPGVTAVGLDPDPRALAWAVRKARRSRLAIRFDRGFAAALPYEDGGFDLVFSAFMLHHLPVPDRVAALREVRRVLAPGGSLHLMDLGGPGEDAGPPAPDADPADSPAGSHGSPAGSHGSPAGSHGGQHGAHGGQHGAHGGQHGAHGGLPAPHAALRQGLDLLLPGRARRHADRHGAAGPGILASMAEAGLADPAVTGQGTTRLGPYTIYRAAR
jgi:SAM-dependent methyltransferase